MTLGQGQGMTLTLNTHAVSFTYLATCIYKQAAKISEKYSFDFFPYKAYGAKVDLGLK